MNRGDYIRLGLVNSLVSVALFAAAMLVLGALVDPRATIFGWPYVLTLVVTLVGPAIIAIDVLAGIAASFARKSKASAQTVGLVVASCLAFATMGSRYGLPPSAFALLIRLTFVGAIALPWMATAGFFHARKA